MKTIRFPIFIVFLTLAFSLIGCSFERKEKEEEYVGSFYVQYNANGGKGEAPAGEYVRKGGNTKIPGQGDLINPGKKFKGWNTSYNGKGTAYAPGDIITVTDSLMLYAQWIVQYTVTYDINGGVGVTPEAQTVDEGETITLADGSGFSKEGYPFGGWFYRTLGTDEYNNAAGSSFKPNRDFTLYAIWVAPRIKTGDSYKKVNEETVEITLETSAYYTRPDTEEYRLYRSGTEDGGYTLVDTITPSADLVLKDSTVDWVSHAELYYKVAAVSGGTETMSANGVLISLSYPKVYARRSSGSGYLGVRLYYGGSTLFHEWEKITASPNTIYELVYGVILSSTYTYETASVSGAWKDRGEVTFKPSHNHTIYVDSSYIYVTFNKDMWNYFTP
jgi:uncharacterized repeat protein (TIGR02543 family)